MALIIGAPVALCMSKYPQLLMLFWTHGVCTLIHTSFQSGGLPATSKFIAIFIFFVIVNLANSERTMNLTLVGSLAATVYIGIVSILQRYLPALMIFSETGRENGIGVYKPFMSDYSISTSTASKVSPP